MPDPLSCCVCGATEALVWRVAPDNLRGGDALYRAVRCARCGTARLDPRPPEDVLARAHGPGTYARAEEDGDGVGARLDALSRDAAARADAAGRRGRLLDVGCGDGRFLAAMAALGWQGMGTETDAEAARLARRRTGVVVHEGPLEELETSGGFDMVSLLHVLEHVPDPRQTLVAAHRLLRPGGVLFLALPNAGSLEATLFRSAWYHLDLPRHLWGFTPRTLVRLVEESGFAVRSLDYLPFLFAPQSLRTALRRKRRDPGGSGDGAGRTRVFLALLRISRRLGQRLPGEIMELIAVRGPKEEIP